MLLSEGITGFLLDCKARNLSPKTIEDAYGASLHELCEFLEDPPLGNITADDLRRFTVWLQERPKYSVGHHAFAQEKPGTKLSPHSIHRSVRVAKTFFRWCVKEELIKADPTRNLQKPKISRGRIDFLSQEQVTTLLSVAKKRSYRDYTLMFFMLDTGVRRTELIHIKLDDVNLINGHVEITHGKGGKTRTLRIGNACRKVLWRYVTECRHPLLGDKEEYLFLSDTTKGPLTYEALGNLFRHLSESCGFRVYAHKLRHTYATNLARQVKNAFMVAAALGHEDLNTSRIYVHLAGCDLDDASPMDEYMKTEFKPR